MRYDIWYAINGTTVGSIAVVENIHNAVFLVGALELAKEINNPNSRDSVWCTPHAQHYPQFTSQQEQTIEHWEYWHIVEVLKECRDIAGIARDAGSSVLSKLTEKQQDILTEYQELLDDLDGDMEGQTRFQQQCDYAQLLPDDSKLLHYILLMRHYQEANEAVAEAAQAEHYFDDQGT
jgi:hypothetical protein